MRALDSETGLDSLAQRASVQAKWSQPFGSKLMPARNIGYRKVQVGEVPP